MKKSFTLIEVVFAVGIIVIFLGSLIALFNVGSKNMVVSAHRLQAANLARGAVEAAREVRDTAKLQGVAWTGSPLTVNMGNNCWLPEAKAPNYDHPVSSTDPTCGYRLGLVAGSDTAPYNSVTFTRQINIITSGDIRTVTATVSWTDFGQPHSVIVTTYLTNY